MGNLFSPDKNPDGTPKDPPSGGYGASGSILGGVYASAGGIVGGGKDKVGLDLVEDYANSVYSKAKKELILKLASAASSAMQMGKRSFSDVDEAVKFLVKTVPNPKKGEKVKPGAGIHRKVCEALAVEINAAYGTKLISSDDNDRVCNEVAEVVHSLVHGLHMEFAGVAADVDQVSKNLMILLTYLKENHNKYDEIINKSNDPEIKASSEIVTTFYKKLIEEVERQLAVLNNIVGNVIGPVGKDLVALVEQSDSFKGMVENIKNELGTKEFGEKLGYVLSGVSDSAQAAKIVEQALKEVGMSIAEYRNTKGVEDLKNKIFEALGRSGKQLGGEEIVKFVKAADVLYRYDFRQPQILEYLKKAGGVDPKPTEPEKVEVAGGTGCGCGGEGADGGGRFGVSGGALGNDASDIFERKTDLKQSLSVKTRELDRFREELFSDFEKSMLTHYRNVVGIIAQIGPKLGSEIPIDEHVRSFVRHFGKMDDTNRNNIARALSGYNKSGASLANRNRFIADFAKLLTLAGPLASKSSLFKNLENEIKELNNLIDIFGEKFVKAIQSPLNPRVKGPYAKGGEDGGDAYGGMDGGDFVPSTVNTGSAEKYASFGKAKLQLSYYMAIANIKRSMARAATDDIGTDEAYKSMMGQSVALMIKAEAGKLKQIDERLTGLTKMAPGLESVKSEAGLALLEKARDLAKRQFTAKKELLECAQNIDLYLRAFTADAVSKPDTLIKLSGVLQQFVNIRKFYTHTAGKNIAELFEQFPGRGANYAGNDEYVVDAAADAPTNHRAPLNFTGAAVVGDALAKMTATYGAAPPAEGEIKLDQTAAKKVDNFTKKLDDVVYGVRALENVLLAFAQIGNEQTDKTFMSHGKVLKVLSEYIAASAYSIRHQSDPAPAGGVFPAIPVGVVVNADYGDGGAVMDEALAANNANQIMHIVLNQSNFVGGANGAFVNDFEQTNKVFVYILKAICGKILTVLGLYSIYNMPNADYMSISAVRTILGGSAEKPVIIPEALELYIRLPLLAEWLRTSFVNVDGRDALAAAGNYAIAMIPDSTSPWSEFLKIFLIKTNHVVDGNYNESDVYGIIGEINKIYTAYREKSPEDTTYAAMEGLIKDFNSRYGIMKSSEVKEYMAKYRNQDDYSDVVNAGRNEDFNNFDLLDSKNARSSGSAPSDRYLETSTLTTSSGIAWSTQSEELVKRLHYNIASKFRDNYKTVMGVSKIGDMVNVTSTIHGVVEQYKYEIAAASSNDEKVKLVTKAIQTVGVYNNQNPSKFLMFHEMVVSPLYSLFRLYQTIRQVFSIYDSLNRMIAENAARNPELVAAFQPILTSWQAYPDNYAAALAAAPPGAAGALNNQEVDTRVVKAIGRFGTDGENNALYGGPLAASQVSKCKLLRLHFSLLTALKVAFGDLISINVGGTGKTPILDMNSLKDYSGTVLENVKKALSSMRSYMPPQFVEYFENINNYGSVFWVQSHMMDQLFGNNDQVDGEVNLNIKKLNNLVKSTFTDARRWAEAAAGVPFEAAYDLCFWRISGVVNAAHVRPTAAKELPFPSNVIQLVDDMNPTAGEMNKAQAEKIYGAVITNFAKAVTAYTQQKGFSDAQGPGGYNFNTNAIVNAQGPAVNLDVIGEIKDLNIQDGSAIGDVKLRELESAFQLIRNAAAAVDAERGVAGPVGPGLGPLFAGAADPANIIPASAHVVVDVPATATVNNIAIAEYVASVIPTLNPLTTATLGGLPNNWTKWLAAAAGVYKTVDGAGVVLTAEQKEQLAEYIVSLIFGGVPARTATLRGSMNGIALPGGSIGGAVRGLITAINGAGPVGPTGVGLNGTLPVVAPAGSVTPDLSAQYGAAGNQIAPGVGPILSVIGPLLDVDYLAAQYDLLPAAAPVAVNIGQAMALPFLNNHGPLKVSYDTAKNILSTIKAQPDLIARMRPAVNQGDQATAVADKAMMDAYTTLYSGTTEIVNMPAGSALIFNILNTNNGFENNGPARSYGLVAMFNRIIQQYMNTFFDRLNSKFYSPLVEDFATGHFSPAIVNSKAYSDVNIMNDAGGASPYGIVPPGIVVASSNARGIRLVLNKRDDKGVAKLYALNSLADVSPGMKETMRANLPLFRSAFKDLYEQAEILKRLLFATLNKDQLVYARGVINDEALIAEANFKDKSATMYLNRAVAHPELTHNYFKQAIELVQQGCDVLMKASNQVYKELNDAPLFGETYNGSLTEFKQKAGVYPVTPVSLAQFFVNEKFMPGQPHGGERFKLAYALRGFSDFQISKAPVYEELLRMYNITVPEGAKMNSKYFEEYTKSHVPLLQMLVKLNGHATTFNDTNNSLGGLLAGSVELNMARIRPAANVDNNNLKPFVVSPRSYDDLISLITNTDVEYERQRFVELYARDPAGQANPENERSNIQYRNLIETGIVPVNVNALQREIPLVNLLNYAYTFEKYVIESLGVVLPAAGNEIIADDLPANASRSQMMAFSLAKPYGAIGRGVFDNEYKDIIIGSGSEGGRLRFERPKFISDQIWNRLCMRSMMKDSEFANAPAAFDNFEDNAYARAELLTAKVKALAAAIAAIPRSTQGDVYEALKKLIAQLSPKSAEESKQLRSLIDTIDGAAPADAAARNTAALGSALVAAVAAAPGVPAVGAQTHSKIALEAAINNNAAVIAARAALAAAVAAGAGVPVAQGALVAAIAAAAAAGPAQVLRPAATANPGDTRMYYITKDGKEEHTNVINWVAKQTMGKRRFDTVLIRNLVWTVQLHRFLTWSIKDKTRKVVNAVSQGEDAYDPSAVEFHGTEGVESYPL